MKKIFFVLAAIFVLLGGTIVFLSFQNDALRQEVTTLESKQATTPIVTVPSRSSNNDVTTESSETSVSEATTESTVVPEESNEQISNDQVALLNDALVNAFYGTNENRLELLESYMTPTLFEAYNTQTADEIEPTESEIGDKTAYYRQVSDTEYQAVNFVSMSNQGDENTVIMSITYQADEGDWKASAIQFQLIAKVTE